MMNLDKKRREKSGKYDRDEILKLFTEFLESNEPGFVMEEFVIVAKSTIDGEEMTDVFSTTNRISEVVGILETGKLFAFENRGD